MAGSFIDALRSDGPCADRMPSMALHGPFVGAWTLQAVLHAEAGDEHHAQGEIHFDRVLGGRAIPDVWILPGFFFGTTLRAYDPGIDARHILGSDPLKRYYARQIGRARGNDIAQKGVNDVGDAVRWSFVEIGPDRFRWLGERRRRDGRAWHPDADFSACRIRSSPQPRGVLP